MSHNGVRKNRGFDGELQPRKRHKRNDGCYINQNRYDDLDDDLDDDYVEDDNSQNHNANHNDTNHLNQDNSIFSKLKQFYESWRAPKKPVLSENQTNNDVVSKIYYNSTVNQYRRDLGLLYIICFFLAQFRNLISVFYIHRCSRKCSSDRGTK